MERLKATPLTLGALPLTGIGMVAEGLGNAADATAETFVADERNFPPQR